MALLSTIFSLFGSGLGSLFSWAISTWQKYVANKQAASDKMNQDITAHSGDGAISVDDVDSAQWQLDNINQKLKQMDQEKPITPTEVPHA